MSVSARPSGFHKRLEPSDQPTFKMNVVGGPGKVIVQSKQITVAPDVFGPSDTDITITLISGSPGDLVFDRVVLHEHSEDFEIPVTVWWADEIPIPPIKIQVTSAPSKGEVSAPLPIPISTNDSVGASKASSGHNIPRLFEGRICRWCGKNVPYDATSQSWLVHSNCEGLRALVSVAIRMLRESSLSVKVLWSSLIDVWRALMGQENLGR